MRISITISEGSDLEAKMKEFNKHERSALVKMALTKWFCAGSSVATHVTEQKNTMLDDSKPINYTFKPLKQVMGDFSD